MIEDRGARVVCANLLKQVQHALCFCRALDDQRLEGGVVAAMRELGCAPGGGEQVQQALEQDEPVLALRGDALVVER